MSEYPEKRQAPIPTQGAVIEFMRKHAGKAQHTRGVAAATSTRPNAVSAVLRRAENIRPVKEMGTGWYVYVPPAPEPEIAAAAAPPPFPRPVSPLAGILRGTPAPPLPAGDNFSKAGTTSAGRVIVRDDDGVLWQLEAL
jgi:hypothetical protein